MRRSLLIWLQALREPAYGRDAVFAYAALAGAAACAVAASAVGYMTLTSYVGLTTARRADTAAVVSVWTLGAVVREAESGQRGYLLSGDPSYLATYDRAVRRYKDSLRDVSRHKNLDPAVRARFADAAREKMDEFSSTVELARSGRSDRALAVVRTNAGEALMSRLTALAAELTRPLADRVTANERRIERTASVVRVVIPTASVAGPALALLSAWVGLRAVVQRDKAEIDRARAAGEAKASAAELRSAEAVASAATSLAAAADEEARLAREQSRANADLLRAISHDNRAPLNAILLETENATDIMSSRCPDVPAALGCLERVRLIVERQRQQLDAYLTVSRAERDVPLVSEFKVSHVLRDVEELIRPRAEKKGLTFEVVCPSSLKLRSDRLKVHNVLQNLAENAVKYTTTGYVRITAAPSGSNCVTFRVEDSGSGIPAELIPRLFGDFVQGANAERDPEMGFGLGLSIVRRFVTILGGKVAVASAVGEGSTFKVKLPNLTNSLSR